jgi:hypothetical protein
LVIDRGLDGGEQNVRPDITDNEIDLFRFDELVGFLLADIGSLLIVLVNHLDRDAAHFAAKMVQCELERVAHVVAHHGCRSAECADEPDLHGFVLGDRRARSKSEQGAKKQRGFQHGSSPRFFLIARRPTPSARTA